MRPAPRAETGDDRRTIVSWFSQPPCTPPPSPHASPPDQNSRGRHERAPGPPPHTHTFTEPRGSPSILDDQTGTATAVTPPGRHRGGQAGASDRGG
jgi:hypothetical protein